MVDVMKMSVEMAQTYLRYLSEQAPDEATRTEVIATAANGLLFAAAQILLITTPPDHETSIETVN
jgi:hypothetical protein